jgi:hypothetical protein
MMMYYFMAMLGIVLWNSGRIGDILRMGTKPHQSILTHAGALRIFS